MKIQFKNTPEQRSLVQAMASSNAAESLAAMEAFAAFIGPVMSKAYQQADIASFLYRDLPYNSGDDPSIPLDLYSDVAAGHFTITSSSMPGGLATNAIYQPTQELKMAPYRYDAAINILNKYLEKARLPVLAKGLERLLQEVLVKTNFNAWSTLFAALARASHSIAPGAAPIGHVFASATAGSFGLTDFNQLLTAFKRFNTSWNQGTPAAGSSPARPTDAIVSPEITEFIRSFSFQPVNTVGGNRTAITAASDQASAAAVPLPEAERRQIFSNGGIPEFFGLGLVELNELGPNQMLQTVFANYIGNTTLPYIRSSGSSVTFNPATQNLAIIVDATKDYLFRAIATDSDTDSTFKLEVDDQFVKRSGRKGWYGGIEEARVVLDSRGMIGMAI